MDITTFIGIISGVFVLIVAIFMGGGLAIFINVPSMMVVVGGTFAATLINYPLPEMLRLIKVVKNAFLHKVISPVETINKLVSFAEIARKNGMLALDKELKSIDDNFLREGMQLAVDGMDPELIRNVLEVEKAFLEERHTVGQGICKAMGKYAPAFGMLGTLIGLIQMLRSLDDPTQIGPGMAVALITTFYGALMANLLFLPLAGKLETLSQQELLLKELAVEGILAIQAGDSPRIVEQKLRAFLAPHLRAGIKRKRAGEGEGGG